MTSFSRMVSELHAQLTGFCELFKLVETFQLFFGLKFCCFLSWRNDPTKLWGDLQHLMPAINQDLEVWMRQDCYWAAWKCFKLEVIGIKSSGVLWGQWWEQSVAMQSCLGFAVCTFLYILDMLPWKLLAPRLAIWKADRGKTCSRIKRGKKSFLQCVSSQISFWFSCKALSYTALLVHWRCCTS